MASSPPSQATTDWAAALPLSYPDRAALNAEVKAALSPRPMINKAPIYLQPCSPGPSAVLGTPTPNVEDAQEFIFAAADWLERGAKVMEPIKCRTSIVADFFEKEVNLIERQALKRIEAVLKAAEGRYTADVANEVLAIKQESIVRLGKLDPPMTWFKYADEEGKVALRAVDRAGTRIGRALESSGLAQEKNLRRSVQKIIELPTGAEVLTKWTRRITVITIVIDVGPSLLKMITAKDDEREKATRSFVSAAGSTVAGMAAGEVATFALLLVLGSAGWTVMVAGIAAAGVGIFAGRFVKEWIDPADSSAPPALKLGMP